jgi:hypothetical protein
MGLLACKEPSAQDVCRTCIGKCQALIQSASQPGLQCKEQCRQLQRFVKSVQSLLEDLSENGYADTSPEAKAVMAAVKLVRTCTAPNTRTCTTVANLLRWPSHVHATMALAMHCDHQQYE